MARQSLRSVAASFGFLADGAVTALVFDEAAVAAVGVAFDALDALAGALHHRGQTWEVGRA